jgi:hypothetical protein
MSAYVWVNSVNYSVPYILHEHHFTSVMSERSGINKISETFNGFFSSINAKIIQKVHGIVYGNDTVEH